MLEKLSSYNTAGAQLEGEGGKVYPALFQKLKKSALILRKNVLIVVIYKLNFSFKMQSLRVSRRKNRRFMPVGSFFLVFIKVS